MTEGPLGYDGRVAIVTGAGHGLGRAHARLLASRGARVVVNDLGGDRAGQGRSAGPADQVVAEIREAGGEAVANHESVEDGSRVVEQALDEYGRVDIVVNNAGILRDRSFQKMSEDEWDAVYRVHVLGAFRVTRAAWEPMREARHGRVVLTSSGSGVYGNFGQSNYSMAKLGLYGLGRTLAIEGASRDIRVNTIAPAAGSRMTSDLWPPEVTEALRPDLVSPLVAYLCHESCPVTGGLFEVGAGWVARLRWERSEGVHFGPDDHAIEDVRDSWDRINDFSSATHPEGVADAFEPLMRYLPESIRRAWAEGTQGN